MIEFAVTKDNRIMDDELIFASPFDDVKTPSKKSDDAGYDIYAHFEEEHMVIKPHETKMIPTDLHTAFNENYVMILKERGSTGSKGIGQRCGVVDSSFRGAIFVPITNHNDKPLLITKETNESALETLKDDYIVYPYSKAICQAVMAYVPKLITHRVSMDVYAKYTTERGSGALGSSGK